MNTLPTELKNQLEETISLYSPEEKKKLAENPESLSPNLEVQTAILTLLSKDPYLWVRHAVAENPKSPKEAFSNLSQDKFSDVRLTVAQTLRCPPEVLTPLLNDPINNIRTAAEKTLKERQKALCPQNYQPKSLFQKIQTFTKSLLRQ